MQYNHFAKGDDILKILPIYPFERGEFPEPASSKVNI